MQDLVWFDLPTGRVDIKNLDDMLDVLQRYSISERPHMVRDYARYENARGQALLHKYLCEVTERWARDVIDHDCGFVESLGVGEAAELFLTVEPEGLSYGRVLVLLIKRLKNTSALTVGVDLAQAIVDGKIIREGDQLFARVSLEKRAAEKYLAGSKQEQDATDAKAREGIENH